MIVFIVYVTYMIEVEEMHVFTQLVDAQKKYLELANKIIENKSFNTVEEVEDYFVENENDSFVGIKQAPLTKGNRIRSYLEEDILERYCNSEYYDMEELENYVDTLTDLTEDEKRTLDFI